MSVERIIACLPARRYQTPSGVRWLCAAVYSLGGASVSSHRVCFTRLRSICDDSKPVCQIPSSNVSVACSQERCVYFDDVWRLWRALLLCCCCVVVVLLLCCCCVVVVLLLCC